MRFCTRDKKLNFVSGAIPLDMFRWKFWGLAIVSGRMLQVYGIVEATWWKCLSLVCTCFFLVWMPWIKLEDHEDKPRKQGVLNLKLPGLLFLKAQSKVRGDLRNMLPLPHQTLYGSICVGRFCRGYWFSHWVQLDHSIPQLIWDNSRLAFKHIILCGSLSSNSDKMLWHFQYLAYSEIAIKPLL